MSRFHCEILLEARGARVRDLGSTNGTVVDGVTVLDYLRAVRRGESMWAVEASRIEVLALPDAPGGDSIDVTRTSEETILAVEGQRIFGSVPALEERGEREGADYAVHAERLDGDLWEIRAAPL